MAEPLSPSSGTSKLPDDLHELARSTVSETAMVSLLVHHADGASVATLEEGGELVMGRSPAAELQLSDHSLSWEHARFEVEAGGLYVVDLGSTNGVRRGGERLEHRTHLRDGDIVSLGAVRVSVRRSRSPEEVLFGIDSHDVFAARLEEEIARARYFGRTLAVLTLRSRGDDGVEAWCDPLLEALRPVDRVGLYGPGILEVLLPELAEPDALDLARRLTATEALESRGVVAGLAFFPETGTSAGKLVAASRAATRKAADGDGVAVAPKAHTRTLRSGTDDENLTAPVVRSPAMRELWETVERVAASSIPVLVQGETGSGKEVVARALHDGGPRKGKPLVCLNCGAIPAELIESMLFGHEQGAFTGAARQSQGVFESAGDGTVFLDEIGELPARAQVALLRVLESRRFSRVGSTRELETGARVIAATHRDLEQMCEEERFRWDLLYRLNAISLDVPPLRRRREELGELVSRFVARAAAENGREIAGLTDEAMACIEAYGWPGNVRELRNAIERAVVICRSEVIGARDLPRNLSRLGEQLDASEVEPPVDDAIDTIERPSPPPVAAAERAAEASEAPVDLKSQVRDFEARLLLDALRDAGGNQTEAARRLGLPVRTLSYKLRSHGIRKSVHQAE